MDRPSLFSEIDAVGLVELRAQIAGLLAAADALLTGGAPTRPAGQELLPLKLAAAIANRDERTIRRWCSRFKIGGKVGGRWTVDRARLEALLRVL